MAIKIEDMKVGDRFIFHKCKRNKEECQHDTFSIGRIYTVIGEPGDLEFVNDDGGKRSLEMRIVDENMKITKIVD